MNAEQIQSTVNAAAPGSKFIIPTGTYAGCLTLTCKGTAAAPIIIDFTGATLDAAGKPFGVDLRQARYITLKRLTIRNAANGLQNENAALRIGSNQWIEDVTVDRCAGAAVGVLGNDSTLLRVTASYNGQIGIGGAYCSRVLVKDCSSFGNNTKRYDPGWEAGGGKWSFSDGVTIDGGRWFDNTGPAIWFDYQNRNFVVRNTEVFNNKGRTYGWEGVGIASEINPGPFAFENNLTYGNQGGGLAVWESMKGEVVNNVVADGIGNRNLIERKPFLIEDVSYKNNVLFGKAAIGWWGNMTPAYKAEHRVVESGTRYVLSGAPRDSWKTTTGSTPSVPPPQPPTPQPPTPPAPAQVRGLIPLYYSNENCSGLPIIGTSLDPTIDHNFGAGSPDPRIKNVDHWSVAWVGALQPAVSGAIAFRITSDDGVTLNLDTALLINNWSQHAPTVDVSRAVHLKAGQSYPLLVRFFDRIGGATIKVEVQVDGGAWKPLPNEWLAPELLPSSGAIA